jgi:hypothetical protein
VIGHVSGFPNISGADSVNLLLELAADCFAAARFCPSEADEGEEYLAAAIALAGETADVESTPPPPQQHRRQRRPRKPSIPKMIAAAERGGKKVTSVTTPEGVTLRFGESEPPTEASNPWLDDLKVTKQ